MKNTAVDWLVENYGLLIPTELIEVAKEIEKQQIIKAYQDGKYVNAIEAFEAIEYYNETFIYE